MENTYDVFISYSRKDKDRIQNLLSALEVYKISYWLDTSEIDYSETFTDSIACAIDNADSVLFICTNYSIKAEYCKKELNYARLNNKKIRAILFDGFVPKQGWFALEFGNVNCVNYTDQSQFDKLMQELEDAYQPVAAVTRKKELEDIKEAAKQSVREEFERKKQKAAIEAARQEKERLEKVRKKTKLHFNSRSLAQRKGCRISLTIVFVLCLIILPGTWFWTTINSELPLGPNTCPERTLDPSIVSMTYSKGTLIFIIKSVTFTMVKVDGGTFTMGARIKQRKDADDDERPTHPVTLSDYYIGQTEVTQALWEAIMGESVTQIANREGWSTYGVGADYPMYYISYDNCTTFVDKLNTLLSSQLGGKRFALPTEAQWEFAARGGNKSKDYKYAGSNNLDEVAWYNGNSDDNTHPVAQKQPNELGLYDMSGNVYEWCKDWYDDYSSNAQTDPQGPADGSGRVYRGGSWVNLAGGCRVSDRSSIMPAYRSDYLGLRLCLLP